MLHGKVIGILQTAGQIDVLYMFAMHYQRCIVYCSSKVRTLSKFNFENIKQIETKIEKQHLNYHKNEERARLKFVQIYSSV